MTLRNGFTLGSWTVYPLEGRLVSDGTERRVQPKAMDVLVCLAEAAGEVVEREYLLHQVWGETAPTDEPLTRCIGDLRRALDDSRSQPTYIQTVPKRGYKLLQPAEVLAVEDESVESSAPVKQARMPRARKGLRAAVIAVAVLVAVGLLTRPGWFRDEPASVSEEPFQASAVLQSPSIVILPFTNLSADAGQEYFSDGITEELLNLLARFPDLRVISRSSAFSYRDRNADAQTIAAELNVSHILEGSVRRSGQDVRIRAQLIDARADTQVWSATFDRTLGDIFATQDEIAGAVVDRLKVDLLGDRPIIRERNPESYELYLRARYVARQFTPEAFDTAIALLEQALALDPEYADAWDELGRNYRRQAGQGLRPVDESYALSRNATDRAIALDPTLASAHRSLAVIARNYDRDLAAAAAHIKRAYDLGPTIADTIGNAAAMAGSLGRIDQAIALQEHAASSDPVNSLISTHRGVLYLHAGRYDDAIAAFRSTLILNRGYIGAYFLIGEAHLLKGEPEAAMDSIQAEEDEGYRLIGEVMAFHALGDSIASDAALAELIEKFEQDAPYNIAYTLAYRGETDRALEWLEKAVTYNDPGLADIITEPLLANVQSDPRWIPFLERIGKSPRQLAGIEFELLVER